MLYLRPRRSLVFIGSKVSFLLSKFHFQIGNWITADFFLFGGETAGVKMRPPPPPPPRVLGVSSLMPTSISGQEVGKKKKKK